MSNVYSLRTDGELAREIDNWYERGDFKNKSEAIKDLIKRGLNYSNDVDARVREIERDITRYKEKIKNLEDKKEKYMQKLDRKQEKKNEVIDKLREDIIELLDRNRGELLRGETSPFCWKTVPQEIGIEFENPDKASAIMQQYTADSSDEYGDVADKIIGRWFDEDVLDVDGVDS